jgi:hypothetical protein
MASEITSLSFSITPTQAGSATPCTVKYEYQLHLDKLDVHDALAKFVRDKMAAESPADRMSIELKHRPAPIDSASPQKYLPMSPE